MSLFARLFRYVGQPVETAQATIVGCEISRPEPNVHIVTLTLETNEGARGKYTDVDDMLVGLPPEIPLWRRISVGRVSPIRRVVLIKCKKNKNFPREIKVLKVLGEIDNLEFEAV